MDIVYQETVIPSKHFRTSLPQELWKQKFSVISKELSFYKFYILNMLVFNKM